METNDSIVVRANFEGWRSRVADLKGGKPWLYYCVEQFVKPYDLDDVEIRDGFTEGGGDGGADAVYFIVNQRQLVDDSTVLDPKSVSKIRLIFLQAKQSGGFKPTEIEKWINLADDFFDLAKPADGFGQRYNPTLVQLMKSWKEQYIKVSGSFPTITIDYYYYVTGDAVSPDSYSLDSCKRVKAITTKHVGAACEVHLVGAKQLWEQVQRRPPKSKNLVLSENPMTTQDDSYVCLVHLKDFAEFLQDEPGVLAERIFESNVRGYQSDYPVNKQIKDSLGNANVKANFWLLNNGITILGSRVTPAGSRGLSIEDPQIVNGLQTSREIFAYFAANLRKEKDTRSVLVRVIQIADSAVQDLIIKSTNSQTKMSGASLRMTDQIHRNMEELFKKVDFYYDRRKGFWRDQGKAAAKIVSVNTVAQAVVSIVLQRPDDARARPGNYFKDDNKYELVFGESALDLPAYLTCVQLLRRVEDFLANKEIDRADQKNLKFYVLALLARALTSCRQPRSQLLLDIDIAKIDDKQINLCFQQASRVYRSLAKTSDKDTVARGGEMLKRLNKPPRQKTDKKSA